MNSTHTILLMQPGELQTRTYKDYWSILDCMEGICQIYEGILKRRNPNAVVLTYNISQLFDYIDQLPDFSCLVYQTLTNTYTPYNKDKIKETIYVLLRDAAMKQRVMTSNKVGRHFQCCQCLIPPTCEIEVYLNKNACSVSV